MHICDLLDPRAIRLNVKVKTKEQAINYLVDLMSNTDCLSDPDRFRAAVFDRESKVSTGLGEGVAIPHAKSAGVEKPGLAAMVVPDGVDFDSLDGKPTNLFFLIASPHQASDAHLDVLARLSTLLVSDDFRKNLAECKSVDEFLNIINNAEKKEIKKGNVMKKILKRGAIIGGYVVALNVAQQLNVFAADDPISVVNNLSNFIFGLIRAVGMIILGF